MASKDGTHDSYSTAVVAAVPTAGTKLQAGGPKYVLCVMKVLVQTLRQMPLTTASQGTHPIAKAASRNIQSSPLLPNCPL